MGMSFFVWHYTEGLRSFFEIWKNYLEFFWHYFSINRFFETLFSAWRRDISRVAQRGLHPVLFLQAMLENIITRILGAIVKTGMIFIGLTFEILALFLGAILFFVWVSFPLVFIFSFGELIFSLAGGSADLALFWLFIFFVSILLVLISLFSYRGGSKDYYVMSLPALAKEKWFGRVFDRIGTSREVMDEATLDDEEKLKEYLRSLDLSPEEFASIIEWERIRQISNERRKKFWLRENLMSTLPVGRHWTYAYTVHLDKYSKDLSLADYSEYRDAVLIGKESELNELKKLLLRESQNNVILIGEPGVGKETLIHTLAREIRCNQSHPYLANKRILELDIKEILANYSSSGEEEKILGMLFYEAAYAGNIVLVLKDMHEYVDADGRDISPTLSEFLSLPTFQIIGTTNPADFHSKIEKKANVMKYCEKMLIEEMNQDNTLKVMHHKLENTERKQVIFTYQALREIVKLSDRYIADAPFPEKALDLMEEVVLHWNNSGTGRLIDVPIVNEAVSEKIKVPLGEVGADESQKLLDLEDHLHRRVIGQEYAIRQIAETMRRARIGMADKKKPVGSFLFLGPTGVGKTESSKALAEAYFGDENRMTRLDMSEYQAQESIDRLIGSSRTNKEGYLISKVKENPYSLLLLDEIEKAYPDILNLFLQVLDEGYLTDAFGKKISFRNLIIIATSNAGSEIIKESIQSGLDPKDIQERVIDYAIRENIFRPEFLNRFEGVVFFHPLSPDDIRQVTRLLLERYSLGLKDQKNIQVHFDAEITDKVAEEAYDPVFGARAISRYIEDKIGDVIVKKIIAGEMKSGEDFVFHANEIE
jgi:ATP-dependent Clp protease ATP-binding subunit ClpC